ncbi:MAG TPA: hypothetical protein VMM15_37330 [Bradyrhizobium sp.]|nr:hypothetical protein [Bradyrhizobium sp.]
MPDVYTAFADAWEARVIYGSSFASQLHDARQVMKAARDYDEWKYLAALFAAEQRVVALFAADRSITSMSS